MSYTIIDIETTGLSKHRHKITEIGAAKVRDGKIVEQYQTLVNPGCHIPSFITKLTGINDDMVKDAPTIASVLPEFMAFLGEDVFVAHNATFDFGFLDHNLQQHHNQPISNKRLCTRKLANRMFPDMQRKRLQDLCSVFNVTNIQAHRALADVQATAEVFSNMLRLLNDQGINDIDSILNFECSKIKKEVVLFE